MNLGLLLDGNQDGTGGDDWSIIFRTGPPDFSPPNIVHTSSSSALENMDLQPIFNIVWDEPINPASVSPELIKLERMLNLSAENTYLEHFVQDGKSMVVLYAENRLYEEENYRVVIFPGIEDQLGNVQTEGTVINFTTAEYDYSVTAIDDFESGLESNWFLPSDSGGTTGIIGAWTSQSENSSITVVNKNSNKSMKLQYAWDTAAGSWLIREYLASCPPRSVPFTSSSIMQVYIFGDGNGNKFRFCVDDNVTADGGLHEVSPWTTIDWYGWKLVT